MPAFSAAGSTDWPSVVGKVEANSSPGRLRPGDTSTERFASGHRIEERLDRHGRTIVEQDDQLFADVNENEGDLLVRGSERSGTDIQRNRLIRLGLATL